MNKDEHRTQVGPYQVSRRLSTRGTSEVYLGASEETGKSVILRVLRAETTASLVIRDRVLRKAEIAKSFNHPTLVPVQEVIRDGREIIVVRDFIDGADLTRVAHGYRSAEEAFPASGALVILMEVLEALSYLQEQAKKADQEPEDWFHGGLTPRNVFVTSTGQIRITGFGFGELGLGDSSVEAWKGRRMNAMSPRWICAGHMEQEEDLFAAGSLAYGLLMENGVYGTLDTSSPEDLKKLARGWGGLHVDSLAERLGSMSLAAVLKRLTSPRPAANFPSAGEALHALTSLVRRQDELTKSKVLKGLLDGTEKNGATQGASSRSEVAHHPLGEGGATRSILEAGIGEESAVDGVETLRGATVDDLGDDFQDVKRSFEVIKSQTPGDGISRGQSKPQLNKNKGRSAVTSLSEQTLELDASSVFGGSSGKQADDPTLDIHGRDLLQDEAGKLGGATATNRAGNVGEDRTLDLDGGAVFQEKHGQTVVRVKTPTPSRIIPASLRSSSNSEGQLRVRKDSKIGWERAVLADKLPPISRSTTFRLLAVALGVLFLLIGLLIFLWIRKMDVIRYTSGGQVSTSPVGELFAERDASPPEFKQIESNFLSEG